MYIFLKIFYGTFQDFPKSVSPDTKKMIASEKLKMPLKMPFLKYYFLEKL